MFFFFGGVLSILGSDLSILGSLVVKKGCVCGTLQLFHIFLCIIKPVVSCVQPPNQPFTNLFSFMLFNFSQSLGFNDNTIALHFLAPDSINFAFKGK